MTIADTMIDNPFTYGTQKYRLLQALNYGPVNTQQLLHDPSLSFASHVRRMKDVRDYLHIIGYTIKKTRLNKTCFEYRLSQIPEKVPWWAWLKNLFKQKEALLNG